jgi:hypothetical protein
MRSSRPPTVTAPDDDAGREAVRPQAGAMDRRSAGEAARLEAEALTAGEAPSLERISTTSPYSVRPLRRIPGCCSLAGTTWHSI